jgi:hypothetical protein
MSEWFVYCHVHYYPWAVIVEAESAEAAIKAAHIYKYDRDEGVVVIPADAIAYHETGPHDQPVLDSLRGLPDERPRTFSVVGSVGMLS